MSKTVIYYSRISSTVKPRKLEHLAGEILLETGLKDLYHKELKFEPRSVTEHGKPFFTREPGIHYNISHSGNYVLCAFSDQEVGVDVQQHRQVSMESILKKMVKPQRAEEILRAENPVKEFFEEWVRLESRIKWTGEGFARKLSDISGADGHTVLLSLPDEGYSAAVTTKNPTEITLKEIPSIDIPSPSL